MLAGEDACPRERESMQSMQAIIIDSTRWRKRQGRNSAVSTERREF
jgi:hypothetical protein